MRLLPACAVLLLTMLGTAQAQTVLTLSANGTNTVDPDQIIASLSAQASSQSAAKAQAEVNREMKQALDAAKALAGVTATTGDYSVYQNTPDNASKPVYQASQNLQLSMAAQAGVPSDAFTGLVGQLQQQGLLLNTLDGNLSDRGTAAAQQGAIDDAIHQIQAQATGIAATLGEHVGKIQSLNVNVNAPGPVLRAAPMMMMAKAEAPPPQAAPGKVTIQANVNATIALTP
jgi:predicted secreted protein